MTYNFVSGSFLSGDSPPHHAGDNITGQFTISLRWKQVAELQLELAPSLPLVNCRSAEINQVLLNLVINAADAIAERIATSSSEKGRITIRTRHENDCAIVEVDDTSCGIPPPQLSEIFDPSLTTKQVGKGTGQGLAITHEIVVNKHGGKLNVASTPGKGTTFVVKFPSE